MCIVDVSSLMGDLVSGQIEYLISGRRVVCTVTRLLDFDKLQQQHLLQHQLQQQQHEAERERVMIAAI